MPVISALLALLVAAAPAPGSGAPAHPDAAASANGTAQAADGTAKAADGTAQAADGTAQAADGTAQATDGTAKSAGSSEKSAGSSEKTAGSAEKSAGSSEKSAGSSEKSAGSSEKTAGSSEKTAGGSEKTAGGSAQAAGGSAQAAGGSATTAGEAAPAIPAGAEVIKQADKKVLDEKKVEDERVAIEDTGRVRMSLPTESDYEEWAAPGFRVSLGYGYGLWRGVGKAWDWNQHTFLLRPQVKLDRYWSLGGAFEFAGQGDGLQWSASFEPTFHPVDQLGISVGAGYGGLEVNRAANGPQAEGPTVTVSHTDQDADLVICSGSALSTLARADYLFVVGPLFSTGPFVQGNAQWTRCQINFGSPDQETGRTPQLTQWWRQQGVTVGWWLSWR